MIIEISHLNNYRVCDDDESVLQILRSMESDPNFSIEFRKEYEGYSIGSGWTSRYRISSSLAVSVTSVRHETAVCLQLGNIARAFYDFIKLQHLYATNQIKQAIFICAITSRGNRAYMDRVISEFSVYDTIFTVPICMIGIQ